MATVPKVPGRRLEQASMPIPARIIAATVAVAVAYFATTAAIALAMAPSNPGLAGSMPLANGPALARAARADLAARFAAQPQSGPNAEGDIFRMAVPPPIRASALAAFKKEPLATEAVVVAALAESRAKPERARAILRQVHRLTKRDEAVALWLAQDAARRSDIPATLRHFDEVLRTSSQSRPLVLQRFAIATSNPEFRTSMARLIAARPPWADEFWTQGSQLPEAASALAELRIILASSAGPSDNTADQRIANALIGQGRFELARRLHRSVLGRNLPETIVRNPDFNTLSVMPPVDWEVYSTGEFGSEIATEETMLVAYGSRNPGGVVARQWIQLLPGQYRLRAVLRTFGKIAGDEVALIVSCLEGGPAREPRILVLADGQNEMQIAPQAGCNNYWLDVRLTPSERSNGSTPSSIRSPSLP
jgi:hypothetical protein